MPPTNYFVKTWYPVGDLLPAHDPGYYFSGMYTGDRSC